MHLGLELSDNLVHTDCCVAWFVSSREGLGVNFSVNKDRGNSYQVTLAHPHPTHTHTHTQTKTKLQDKFLYL